MRPQGMTAETYLLLGTRRPDGELIKITSGGPPLLAAPERHVLVGGQVKAFHFGEDVHARHANDAQLTGLRAGSILLSRLHVR